MSIASNPHFKYLSADNFYELKQFDYFDWEHAKVLIKQKDYKNLKEYVENKMEVVEKRCRFADHRDVVKRKFQSPITVERLLIGNDNMMKEITKLKQEIKLLNEMNKMSEEYRASEMEKQSIRYTNLLNKKCKEIEKLKAELNVKDEQEGIFTMDSEN